MGDAERAGSAIKVIRETSGLTLAQLAADAGTSPGYLSDVENGNREPSNTWLRNITDALADHANRKASR